MEGTRILVEKGVHDDFASALAEAAAGVKPGAMIGPMTTPAQYEKVQEYFRVAEKDGATAAGGEAVLDGQVKEC